MKKLLFFYCMLMSNVMLSMIDENEPEENYPIHRLTIETSAEKEAEINLLNHRYQSYGAHLKNTQVAWQAVKENRAHSFEKKSCCSCNLW